MKKTLMFILFVSCVNAELVITKDVIQESMVNATGELFKELTSQNDKAHEKINILYEGYI